MRDNGALIFHCASDVVKNKKYTLADYGFNKLPKKYILNDLQRKNFPMQLDAPGPKVWSKIHEAITVDDNDITTTDVNQIYSLIKENNITELYYVGYHANICLLWTRSFSIMQMKHNFTGDIFLVDDLTDWFGDYTPTVKSFYTKYVCNIINSKEI